MYILEHWSIWGLYLGMGVALLVAAIVVLNLLRSTRRLKDMERQGTDFQEEWLCQYRIILVLLLGLCILVAVTFLKTISIHSVIPDVAPL